VPVSAAIRIGRILSYAPDFRKLSGFVRVGRRYERGLPGRSDMLLALMVGYGAAFSNVAPADFHMSGVSSPASVEDANQASADANVDTPQRPISLPIARGFGHGIPLSFAIRQVIPAKFHVALANKIDGNRKVSWSGGKPWPEVLHDLLHPLGLHFVTHGATVEISP
jgi:hypothetical protein